jgi:hypothetical protein
MRRDPLLPSKCRFEISSKDSGLYACIKQPRHVYLNSVFRCNNVLQFGSHQYVFKRSLIDPMPISPRDSEAVLTARDDRLSVFFMLNNNMLFTFALIVTFSAIIYINQTQRSG